VRSYTATPSYRQSFDAGASRAGGGSINPQTISDFKPKLLESRLADSDQFFRISDGFQKIFANDKKD
jgi:hypothetical protein